MRSGRSGLIWLLSSEVAVRGIMVCIVSLSPVWRNSVRSLCMFLRQSDLQAPEIFSLNSTSSSASQLSQELLRTTEEVIHRTSTLPQIRLIPKTHGTAWHLAIDLPTTPFYQPRRAASFANLCATTLIIACNPTQSLATSSLWRTKRSTLFLAMKDWIKSPSPDLDEELARVDSQVQAEHEPRIARQNIDKQQQQKVKASSPSSSSSFPYAPPNVRSIKVKRRLSNEPSAAAAASSSSPLPHRSQSNRIAAGPSSPTIRISGARSVSNSDEQRSRPPRRSRLMALGEMCFKSK